MREEFRFGVQKLHEVVPSVWVGFAGSIAIGFAMVDALRGVGRSMVRAGGRPEPGEVVDRWRAEVETGYDDRFPEVYRAIQRAEPPIGGHAALGVRLTRWTMAPRFANARATSAPIAPAARR